MSDSLWSHLLLEAASEEELIEKYRQIYLETYVFDENGVKRVFTDWTGAKVIFAKRAFDHAFSKAKNYRLGIGVHDGGFAFERAKRILWIAEALSAGNIQRYSQSVKDSRGRNKKRPTLVVVEENYVIVLDDPRKEGQPFRFVTAIPATKSYIDTEIRQKVFLAETKRGG